jgi:hypothetical protein
MEPCTVYVYISSRKNPHITATLATSLNTVSVHGLMCLSTSVQYIGYFRLLNCTSLLFILRSGSQSFPAVVVI